MRRISKSGLVIFASLIVATLSVEVGLSTPRCSRQGCPQIPGPNSSSASRTPPVSAEGGIVSPDLSQCAAPGRKIARSKYYEEMSKDTQKISARIGLTSSLYSACHLLSGSTRNACCQKIMERSVSECKTQVLAEEAAENPCAPRRVDCRFLRPAKCLIERTIEKKRVQCCAAIDGQILDHLLNHCEATVAQVSAQCKVEEVPAITPQPEVVGTQVPNETPATSSEF